MPAAEKPFARQHPVIQLIILAAITLVSLAVFSAIAVALIIPLFGVNILTEPDVFGMVNDPEVVRALKFMQFMNSVGIFLIPPIVFGHFVANNKAAYFKLDKGANLFSYFAVVLLIIAVLPMINWMAHVNEQMDLPAGMEAVERWMKDAEERAEQLTEAFLEMETVGALLINLLLIAVIPAIGEELLFRGAIQRLLSDWTRSSHAGIWIAAIVFSAMHGQFYSFLPRMVLGALFGYMLVWSGTLWLPILAHFVNNAFAVLISYLMQSGYVPEDIEETGMENYFFPMGSFILTAFLLFLIYRQERKGIGNR